MIYSFAAALTKFTYDARWSDSCNSNGWGKNMVIYFFASPV